MTDFVFLDADGGEITLSVNHKNVMTGSPREIVEWFIDNGVESWMNSSSMDFGTENGFEVDNVRGLIEQAEREIMAEREVKNMTVGLRASYYLTPEQLEAWQDVNTRHPGSLSEAVRMVEGVTFCRKAHDFLEIHADITDDIVGLKQRVHQAVLAWFKELKEQKP